MEAENAMEHDPTRQPIDWETFYRNYRKPGYVPGFEIVNKLGGGVFGLVYKARKESIGKDYAIKFLKVDDESVRDAVVRELDGVRFFAQIDHPNLVSIEDKGEVDGIPYILMSYAGQETLRNRLENGPIHRIDALKMFVQAARGVQALHEHGLVHFDLKPANIFLKGDIARVGDYGLSKLVTESRNSLSFGRGTPYYMAPEMLKRRGDVRSDIYSLGIVLYECLVGDVPFKGDSEWEVLKKHEEARVQIPTEVGKPEREVIARCLCKDPDARYQAVADLLSDLQAPTSLGESIVIARSSPSRVGADFEPREVPPHHADPDTPPALPSDRATVDQVPEPTSVEFRRGPVGALVHVVFRMVEFAILAVLVPLRAASGALGQTLVFLLQLPVRIGAVLIRAVGYIVIALLLLLLVFGVLALFVEVSSSSIQMAPSVQVYGAV